MPVHVRGNALDSRVARILGVSQGTVKRALELDAAPITGRK